MVVDHRFYGVNSDHRRLWNSRVDPLREVSARSCESSPTSRSSRTLQPSRSTPLLHDPSALAASSKPSHTGSVCIASALRMRLVAEQHTSRQHAPAFGSVHIRPRPSRRLSYSALLPASAPTPQVV